MDNKKLCGEIEEYRNRLYKNDASAFVKIPEFARNIQQLIKNNGNININWDEFIMRMSANYNAQSVIGAADTISELLFDQHDKNDEMIDIKYFEKNKKCISNQTKDIYKSFINIDNKKIENSESIILDINGNIAVNTIDGIIYLNSLLNNGIAEKLWSDEILKAKYYNLVIIYGLSNKKYIKQIIRNVNKDVHVLLYEPDINIFYYNYIYTDMCELLEQDNLYIIVEALNKKYLKNVIEANVSYINIDKLLTYCSPGYDVLYSNQIKKFTELCKSYLSGIAMENNSLMHWSEIGTKNIMYNMIYMIGGTDLYRLKKKMEEVDKSRIPAIIVAAGPSLDKNIKYLKKAIGKAFILGVDSSIRLMLKNKILPDAFVTLDPNKPRVLFEDDRINDIPFFYTNYSTYDVLCNNRAGRILYNERKFIYDGLKKIGKDSDIINVGGSVACAAFAIAAHLGFKNIIVIGQDLAFTDNKKHASVVYDETPVSENERNIYTTVEGVNGEELLTYVNFKQYRDWFEDYILQNPDINFINATEGGAIIHGATHMRLEEAINIYCKSSFDFRKCLYGIEHIFEKNESMKLVNMIKENKNNCSELYNIFDKCISLYGLSVDSSKEEKNNYMDKIDEQIKEMNSYSEMELLEPYARQAQNIELCDLYEESKDTWKTTAQKGIAICKAYKSAVDLVQKLLDEGIENVEKLY